LKENSLFHIPNEISEKASKFSKQVGTDSDVMGNTLEITVFHSFNNLQLKIT